MKIEEEVSTISQPSAKSSSATYLHVVEEAEASGEVAEAYEYFRDHFRRSKVPEILKCFSSSPDLLRIIIQLGSTLVFSEGVLGRRTKEMIATYVSALNRCPYCLDSHGASLSTQGGTASLLNAISTGDLADESMSIPETNLLHFVRKITLESHEIDPEDILNLRASGWQEDEIAESIHVAAMFACFNRVVNAFGLPSQELLAHLHPEMVS